MVLAWTQHHVFHVLEILGSTTIIYTSSASSAVFSFAYFYHFYMLNGILHTRMQDIQQGINIIRSLTKKKEYVNQSNSSKREMIRQ